MRGGHQERPQGQIAKIDSHADPAWMARAYKPVDSQAEQHRRRAVTQGGFRQVRLRQPQQADHYTYRERMAQCDRRNRRQHRAALSFLQPQRDGEQPAHAGIDAVKGAQTEQSQPGPEVTHSFDNGSWITERARRTIAAFETNLVRAVAVERHEKIRIDFEAAVGVRVELHHPALHALRVELLVPGVIERVGEIHALAVAAHLHHLRRAAQRLIRMLRMRCAAYDTAEMHRTGELRIERIGYVVLPQFAGAPARDVQPAIVQREIDVSDQRWHRLEALQ